MSYKFIASIIKDGKWYVAKDLVSGVTTQGKTIENAKENLKEAVELYFEDEKLKAPKNRLDPVFSFMEINYAR
jgi:predicted RNase H-like HicB family nuclease